MYKKSFLLFDVNGESPLGTMVLYSKADEERKQSVLQPYIKIKKGFVVVMYFLKKNKRKTFLLAFGVFLSLGVTSIFFMYSKNLNSQENDVVIQIEQAVANAEKFQNEENVERAFLFLSKVKNGKQREVFLERLNDVQEMIANDKKRGKKKLELLVPES